MELADLQLLLEQITLAMRTMQSHIANADDDAQRGLVATLYTKALVAKLQVQADIERFKS
jgi:hypothetical protein